MPTLAILLTDKLHHAEAHKTQALAELEAAMEEVKEARKLLTDYEGLLLCATHGPKNAAQIMNKLHGGVRGTEG